MQDDWTWYEACSYENGTTEYMKMESPFAEGGESGEGSSHGNHHHKRRLGVRRALATSARGPANGALIIFIGTEL